MAHRRALGKHPSIQQAISSRHVMEKPDSLRQASMLRFGLGYGVPWWGGGYQWGGGYPRQTEALPTPTVNPVDPLAESGD